MATIQCLCMIAHILNLGGAECPSFLVELLEDITGVFETGRFQLAAKDSRQSGVE